jgi:hypothetical protein
MAHIPGRFGRGPFVRAEDLGSFDLFGLGSEFHPPTYNDWWRYGGFYDNRDLRYGEAGGHVLETTGLPPQDCQGFDYKNAGRWTGPSYTPEGLRDPGEYWVNAPKPPGTRKVFVWPSDGKRKSTWGRCKDILQNKGPDIFVATQGQRPIRDRWKNNDQDWYINDDFIGPMPWARRTPDKPYDFRTRKYRRPKKHTWSDAVWPAWDADNQEFPKSYRCRHGDWHNMAWAPFNGTQLPGHSYPARDKGLWK